MDAALFPSNQICEEVTVNAATIGRVRKEVVNGREYWVAPMTLIVPGVLAGSMGPLYYPPEEVARDYQAWNGMPLVRLHPTRNGSPVSGRQPDVMGTEEMGRVYNARIGTGGRLQADGWFDVEATRRIDPNVLERLAKGDPIELSTGLFTVNQPGRGVYQGRSYVATARDYRPDHLAVLPDRTGACSLQDGCGILINERSGMTTATDTTTETDLTPVSDYELTGDLYLDAVVNCMSPKHPGPCAGKFGGAKTKSKSQLGAAFTSKGEGTRSPTVAPARKVSGQVTTGKTGTGASAGKPKVGAAFTDKGAGTRTAGGVSSKASAAPAKTGPAAPVGKPARQVKVSRAEMKAAKKLDAVRKTALAKGDKETAAKATAKLKKIVEKADARAAGSTQGGKGAVGRKLEAKAKEAAMQKAKKAEATKAETTKAEVAKVARDVRSRGREAKAASKYVKAAKDAIAKGDNKKMAKIVEKVRKLKERAEKRVNRNEAMSGTGHYEFVANSLAFVDEAEVLKTLAEDNFDLLDYHLVGNVLFTAPGLLARELHKLTKLANNTQVVVNRLQGQDEWGWLLPPVLNRGGCPYTYDGRAVVSVRDVERERERLVRNARSKRKKQPSDQLKKEGMTAEKACKVMDDGKVNGQWLTKAQKGMFGSLCGEREEAVGNQDTDIDSNVLESAHLYAGTVVGLFAITPSTDNAQSKGCGCGGGGTSLIVNCQGDKKCGPCAAKEAAAKEATKAKIMSQVMNAQKCPYCGGVVAEGEGVCPKCGMVMMIGGPVVANPAEPYKLMDNANPNQARADRGRWENGEKAAVYHAMKNAFGGNDPKPIPAMAGSPGQAPLASDSDADEAAENAHSVPNLFQRVMNAITRRQGSSKTKDEEEKVGMGCGRY